MKAQILDRDALLHSAPSSTAPAAGEVRAGDIVEIRREVIKEGVGWAHVAAPSGLNGYLHGSVQVFKMRKVRLVQDSVAVLDAPWVGAGIRKIYQRGDTVELDGLVRQDGTQWIKVNVLPNDDTPNPAPVTGFIPEETVTEEIKEGDFWKFRGRITRSSYWKRLLIPAVSIVIAVEIVKVIVTMLPRTGYLTMYPAAIAEDESVIDWLASHFPSIIVLIIVSWYIAVASVKRWHDTGRSGWFALVLLVPYVNIVALIVCGLLPGSKGPNLYGPDPRGSQPAA